MSGPSTSPTRSGVLLAGGAQYVGEAATAERGRHARPLAIPALTAAHLGYARSGLAAVAAALGGLAGAAAWIGLDRVTSDGLAPASILPLVIAVLALAGAVLLGLRVLRSGRDLLAAVDRWYGVAPRAAVPGSEQLLGGAGVVRLVLAAVGVAWGLGALAIAALTGTLGAWVGLAVAALALAGGGVLAALGWWRLRSILDGGRSADPGAFAPAPHAWGASTGPAAGVPAGSAPAVSAASPPAPWSPSRDAVLPGGRTLGTQAPEPRPSSSAGTAANASTGSLDPVDTWGPPTPSSRVRRARARAEAAEPDIDQTRLGTGRGEGRGVAVVLEDGSRLDPGVSLIGRDPQPRPEEQADALVRVVHPTVSKTHATVRVAENAVYVTDRSSTNGSTAVDRDGTRRNLTAWQEQSVPLGTEILLGEYRLRIVPGE